jgi:restriction endonuclease Mrr
MPIPSKDEFRNPIIAELKLRGNKSDWRDIVNPVADRLRIASEDRAILTNQGPKSIPMFIQRLRWASYDLSKEGVISRRNGIWTVINAAK